MWQARKRRRKALKMLIKAGRCSPSVLGGGEEEEEGVAHGPGGPAIAGVPSALPHGSVPHGAGGAHLTQHRYTECRTTAEAQK